MLAGKWLLVHPYSNTLGGVPLEIGHFHVFTAYQVATGLHILCRLHVPPARLWHGPATSWRFCLFLQPLKLKLLPPHILQTPTFFRGIL